MTLSCLIRLIHEYSRFETLLQQTRMRIRIEKSICGYKDQKTRGSLALTVSRSTDAHCNPLLTFGAPATLPHSAHCRSRDPSACISSIETGIVQSRGPLPLEILCSFCASHHRAQEHARPAITTHTTTRGPETSLWTLEVWIRLGVGCCHGHS